MIDLPKLSDIDVSGKKVLLRLDLDCEPSQSSDLRLQSSVETLDYLKSKNAEIIILGHRGRPSPKATAGEADPSDWKELSLKPFQSIFDKWGARVEENLRFDPGEESNDPEYAKKLASLGDVYVNEAFASSHRKHSSIVGLPKLLPHAFGFRFIKEIENLSKIFMEPVRPLLFLISGLKKDKLDYINKFEVLADKILVGGRLPDLLGDRSLESVRLQVNKKTIIGNLSMDKEDITLNTIDVFVNEVSKAGTIVLSGPLGKFEDEGHRQGTQKVFEAVVANKNAFKIAGGGDTERAIALSKVEGFDWISVGGGAMLEFLAKKTLRCLEI